MTEFIAKPHIGCGCATDCKTQINKIKSSNPRKTYKIVLLCGGTSNEREISLLSAKGVQQVMENRGHDVVLVDTGTHGFLHTIAHSGADVAFLALHGLGGEDGCIQGALELIGMPYTGSGVLASALAMDKYRAKIMYKSVGLKTADSMLVSDDILKNFSANSICDDIISQIGVPCVVKPVCDGSSVGVTIVSDASDLSVALESCFAVSRDVLVEKFIAGTEITVGILGNAVASAISSEACRKTGVGIFGADRDATTKVSQYEPFALPVVEIVPRGEFYDFDSKYSDGGCEHIIPARISESAAIAAAEAGIAAHNVLGCSGMSRTDIIVDKNAQPWLIETNTIPGMTPVSLLPDAALAAGIEAGELYEYFVECALEKHRLKRIN